jgi:hypothetical protein
VVARLEQWAGEATPIASRTSIRSPWSAPPLPGSPDVEKESLADTDGGEASASSAEGSGTQAIQGTAPIPTGSQETVPIRTRSRPLAVVPPLGPPRLSPTEIVVRTLVIAVPLSMLAGALIAALMFSLWQ